MAYEVDAAISHDGHKTYSKDAARKLLNIKTRTSMNAHLKSLGIWGKGRLSVPDLIEIRKLQIFLAAAPGRNSRQSYTAYNKHPMLLKSAFRCLNIDIEAEIEIFRKAIS